MVIAAYSIGGYYSNGYWWYSIVNAWWLFYWWLLMVMICYIRTIEDYYIINYCQIFYVIISQALDNYYNVGYFKLF